MNYILLSSLIVATLSAFLPLTRQFQMLQQNSYYPSRYALWVKESYAVGLAGEAIIFCASSLLYQHKYYIAQLVLISILFLFRVVFSINQQKKSIKKLAVTSRVKRLFAAALAVFAAFIVLFSFFYGSLASEIFAVLTFMTAFISPIAALTAWTVTFPIEKCISKWYINDAKRILREHKNLTVIGITGSYGKTTTKFILNRILSEKYNVVATPQSFNTPMGVVRTVREKLRPETQIFICEMGAKNIGDIKEICDIVRPKYGIITSVGPQHLETFKTVDNVFKTKFELADEVLKNGGEVFVNGDSEELLKRISTNKTAADKYKVYGTDESFAYHAGDITSSRNGSEFMLTLGKDKTAVTSKLLGRHSIINITGAAALADFLGVTAEQIKFAAAALKAAEHRLELKPYTAGSLLIDDAYNSNPEGCLEAVRVLASFGGMRKVLVTPGLIELGSKEYECNYALGLEAAGKCDIIILVGKNRSKPIREGVEAGGFNTENLYVVSSFAEAMGIYSRIADKNTVVLFENDLPDNYLN